MDPEYAIREANGFDIDTLIAFTVQEAKETEGTDPDLAAIRLGVGSGLEGSAPVTYWVAQTGEGQVVGSISVVTEWSNFRGGYYWWIQSLYIGPDHRGTGLVDLLLNAVVDERIPRGRKPTLQLDQILEARLKSILTLISIFCASVSILRRVSIR